MKIGDKVKTLTSNYKSGLSEMRPELIVHGEPPRKNEEGIIIDIMNSYASIRFTNRKASTIRDNKTQVQLAFLISELELIKEDKPIELPIFN